VWANQSLKWSGQGGDGVGGGLIAQSPHATVTIADNWFEGNRALKCGAAFFADEASVASAYDNVVIGNDGDSAICLDGRAGGDADTDRSYMTLANNTVALNTGAAVLVQDATLHAFNNLFWHNAAADDLTLSEGGAQPQVVFADANVMKGSYGARPGVTVSNAANLEAASVFVSPTLAAFGQLSLGAIDLRPGSAVGSSGLWVFTPALAYAGALAQVPGFDAQGVARVQGSVRFGAYQQ
jgi:hypothetical protein